MYKNWCTVVLWNDESMSLFTTKSLNATTQEWSRPSSLGPSNEDIIYISKTILICASNYLQLQQNA